MPCFLFGWYPRNTHKRITTKSGFTIIEPLIVIVVIATLAAITIAAYSGITKQAYTTALRAELNAHTKVALYQMRESTLPASLSAAGVENTPTVTFSYEPSGTFFCIGASSASINDVFKINQDGAITTCSCAPSAATPTAGARFTRLSGWITGYYSNESNNPANPVCSRNVVIPSHIGGVAIVAIDSGAMSFLGLESVVIRSTVTEIYDDAFSGNSIESATIPQTVTYIANGAFIDSALTSVTVRSGSILGVAFDPSVIINYY